MVAVSKASSIYGNQNPPKYITNAYYIPNGYSAPNTATFNTTINRCYYVPFSIHSAHTFQGACVHNGGAGDNGEKIRLMVFADADGGPGALVKDFGEITLTAAAALRTLSSSWAAGPGIYWAAIWHETAATMYGMSPFFYGTGVGSAGSGTIGMNAALGDKSATALSANRLVAAHYVDTTYGSAPATAVAPTATVVNTDLTGVAVVPSFALLG